LFQIAKRTYPEVVKCKFGRLVETFAFKPQSHSSPQSIVSIEVYCGGVPIQLEMRVEERDEQSVIIHGGVYTEEQTFSLLHPPKFGLDFDLKEEVFRTYPSVVNKLKFPVGSSTSLVENHFLLSGTCLIQTDVLNEKKHEIPYAKMHRCKNTYWSSVYPDPKSAIEFGYDPNLGILH